MFKSYACLVAMSVSCAIGLSCNHDHLAKPDPSFIWEASGHTLRTPDVPFLYERPTLYRTTAVLADLDVRALTAIDTRVWAGTAAGLFEYEAASDRFVARTLLPGNTEVGMMESMKDKESPFYKLAGEALLNLIPLNNFGTADDMKGVTVFLASDASRYVTGVKLVFDGGFTINAGV